jgi:long-chain acyl-CoA synthetase
MPSDILPEFPSALAMWSASTVRRPDRTFIRYFDGSITLRQADEQSDALAAALIDGGFAPGDRLAVFLQNVPAFALSLLAAWKAGGTLVPINPMNKERELRTILLDSGATVLVCHPELFRPVVEPALDGTEVRTVISASHRDYQSVDEPRLFDGSTSTAPPGTVDFQELISRYSTSTPVRNEIQPTDVAFLTYTSGTTGPPKGAMITHANLTFNAQSYREWMGLGEDDVILGVAPLFHVTGLVAHVALSMLLPATLVLAYRFDPGVVLDTIRQTRPTFTVGSITVFIALMNTPGIQADDLASLTKIYSGGAPIAPATVDEFQSRLGPYIHNIYGLTETTSPSHAVPLGAHAPVDPTSGALSVGVPIFNTVVRVVGDDGAEVAPGQVGELYTSGPQVVAGYWQRPEETQQALADGWLRTGDVGFMDDEGWFYIVDRKKDQINVSGYKVWPREVEDVLYQHPAVREAAVVGVPDQYRGETVKAVVSLRPGQSVDPDDLVEFCKQRMAAYKYPRQLEVVDELPKTVSGKILRRELRNPQGH